MKLALVTLFALLAVASARIIPDQIDLEDITAYNYLEKIGLPLAEQIRKAEESETRIVGGSAARAGQFPYQAGLLSQFASGQGVCGGCLVRNNRVVTAAHCWWDGRNRATSFTVVLGSLTIFSGGNRQNSNQVVMHGSYNPSLISNDVAMIRINPVGLSSTIAVIALPAGAQLNEAFAGLNAVASGFGLTRDGGNIAAGQVLSHVTLPVITNAVCIRTFPMVLQTSNICTSGANGRSTCRGDSGGPLAIQRNGRPLLIGITSFGSARGCQRGYPAVFVRVTSFMSFINQNM